MDYQKLFYSLYLCDAPQQVDLIIGFGHFDRKIPEQCAKLFQRGLAPYLLFTGGVGAGSTGLAMPEADFFYEIATTPPFNVPTNRIIVENTSTNTGENIRYSQKLLADKYPELQLNLGVKRVALVANAYRQFRVYYTFKLYFPELLAINLPPETTFEKEKTLFEAHNEDFFELLKGEKSRIESYPAKGFMAPCILDGHLEA